jgi:hypothetical protein
MNSIADVSNGFLSAFSRISAELATSPHVTAKFNQALGILDRTSHEKGKEIVKAGKWGAVQLEITYEIRTHRIFKVKTNPTDLEKDSAFSPQREAQCRLADGDGVMQS